MAQTTATAEAEREAEGNCDERQAAARETFENLEHATVDPDAQSNP